LTKQSWKKWLQKIDWRSMWIKHQKVKSAMNKRMKIRIYWWQRSLRKSCQKLRLIFWSKTQMHCWILFTINWKSLWTWKEHLSLKLLLNWNKIVHTQECSFNSIVLYSIIHISFFSVESSRSKVDARRLWIVKNIIKSLQVTWTYEKKNEDEDANVCNVNIEDWKFQNALILNEQSETLINLQSTR